MALRCTAAVGGGIPWLTNLERVKRLDTVCAVGGIMNGTTNFIMDAMHKAPVDFPAILKEAQDLGYAEADPSADIDGDDIRRKLRRAVTDSDGEIRVDAENKPGVTNLITICAAMSNRTPEQVCQDLAGQGYGALKDAAAEAVIATLAPIQAEHKRIMADKAYIADVLKDGAERASAIAFKTLRKVYKKVGLYQG